MTSPPVSDPAEEQEGPLLLVVDDDDTNRKVARLMLARLGYRADTVPGGPEAVEAVGRTQYAAVLMDCLMPGMSGYEATAEIRSLPAPDRPLPIIAMTAGAMPGDQERALSAGMDDFLTKPVALAALRSVLNQWIPGGSPDATPPQSAVGTSERAHGAGRAPDPVLDPAILAGLRSFQADGPPGLLPGLVALFLDTTRQRLADLREAATADDLPAAGRLAHGLRGSCANLSATGMAACAMRLEVAASDGDASMVAGALRALESEFEHVAPALRNAFPDPS